MLSKKLKELRSEKNVTQDHMANLLNIKRQTYSAYERGVSLPDVNTLIKLANFFGVSVDTLLEMDTAISEKEKLILNSAKNLSDEDIKKLIDYAELLNKAKKQ